MVAERVHGRRRHGVDRVAADQFLDVEHIAVGLVLGPGRSPQQPLRDRTLARQTLPARPREQGLGTLKGQLRVGDRDLAANLLQVRALLAAGGLEALVDDGIDGGIDAADEEACHAGTSRHVPAGRGQSFQALDIGQGDRLVGRLREQQGDVDVDAFADQRGDGRNPGLGARHLDHQVRPVDRCPQTPCLDHGRLRVVRQIGRDLEADEAVPSAGRIEHRAQHIGRLLDVAHGQVLVERYGIGFGRPREGDQIGIVIAGAADRLLEDRWVRRDALEPVALDQRRELALSDQAAADIVQPDRLAHLA